MSCPRDPDHVKATVLRVCLVLWLICWLALGLRALLRTEGPWAQWQAAAQRAEAAHRVQLQAQAAQDYIAWQQTVCGPETGYTTLRDGARACTDKHGRPTGQQLSGAHP